MDTENMTLEDRVERIEHLITNLLKLADSHPMGKMFVKMLGL